MDVGYVEGGAKSLRATLAQLRVDLTGKLLAASRDTEELARTCFPKHGPRAHSGTDVLPEFSLSRWARCKQDQLAKPRSSHALEPP